MTLLREYKFALLALLAIFAAYFLTRFYNLTSFPIFTDEAIYMWWAQTGKIDPTWRFISLIDGKQPLYIWLSMTLMYIFNDPLVAGRLVSIFSGSLTVLGLFLVGNELFKNKWVGVLSALLYVFYPIALVHDRMALYDSLVGALVVWGFYVEILLVRKVHSTLAFILALILGAGMLTKSNAFFTAALIPSTLLLFDFKRHNKGKKLIEWAVFGGVAILLAGVYYSILRLSPFYSVIGKKNAEFVYPISEWIQHPLLFFIGNVRGMLTAFSGYMTIPLIVLIVAAFFVSRSQIKEKLLLLIWFVVPVVYLAFFGKLIYPRFYFFATLFLLPLIAYTLIWAYTKLKNKILFAGFCVLVLLMPAYADYYIISDISNAPIPHADKDQYVTGWSAGGGVKEAIALFESQSKDKKIAIATQGTFGLMPYALEIYLRPNKNIEISSFWPVPDEMPKDLVAKSEKVQTYILFYQACPQCTYIGDAPDSWPLEQVLKVKKSENVYLTVYKVVNK